MKDEMISEKDIQVSPRRVRTEYDSDLLVKLKKVSPKTGIRLRKTFGEVPIDNQAHIRYEIRKHWELIRDDKPSINFSPEGIPQVIAVADLSRRESDKISA